MQPSGVEAAIRELEQEVKQVQGVIGMLKKIQATRAANGSNSRPFRKPLSAKARRRISEAAKKRWAALRLSKTSSGKSARS